MRLYIAALFFATTSTLVSGAALPAQGDAKPILHLTPDQLQAFRHPPAEAGHLPDTQSSAGQIVADKTVYVPLELDEEEEEDDDDDSPEANGVEQAASLDDAPGSVLDLL